MAFATRFSKFDIAVIEIANLTDRCITSLADQAHFTRWHTHLRKIAFFGK